MIFLREKSWRECEASEHVTLYTFLCYVISKLKQVKRLQQVLRFEVISKTKQTVSTEQKLLLVLYA